MSSSSYDTHDCQRTQVEIDALIKGLREKGLAKHSSPHKAIEIDSIESKYSIRLPSDYREFLKRYGLLVTPYFSILGLEADNFDVLSLDVTLQAFRLADVEVPPELCPVEFLEDRTFICLVCDLIANVKHAEVVAFQLHAPRSLEELEPLAACFNDYLFERLTQIRFVEEQVEEQDAISDEAWSNLERHVHEYSRKHNYEHATGGKLPRNHDWRPYRYCIQDVLFGACVVRHSREGNCLEVDVFLTAVVPEYGPLAGALALTSFLFSEAFKCGGTMEIHFTNNVEGGQVPQEIRELGSRYGATVGQEDRRSISSAEAKALYAALTAFSPPLQEAINDLEAQGRAKMARACFVVHHGVWSKEQVEMIVLGSERPDSILGGLTQPRQWHLYQHDLLHARAALLAGMFERLLAQRVHQQGEVDFDLEDDVRLIDTAFDGNLYAKRYASEDQVPLPTGWLLDTDQERILPENSPFHVLVRARDAADLLQQFDRDLEQAAAHHRATGEPTFLILPADFHALPEDEKKRFTRKAANAQLGLLISPDTVLTFDAEAAQKLARSRVLRK